MKINLKIITPVSRPHLLSLIKESLQSLYEYFEVEWFPISDDLGNDLGGGRKRNVGLELACRSDCWIYHLDDDTKIHPDFAKALSDAIYSNVNAKLFVFRYQFTSDNSLRLHIKSPEDIRVGYCDTQQFVILSEVTKDIRWHENNYLSDGIYFEEIMKAISPKDIAFIDTNCCIYNALR